MKKILFPDGAVLAHPFEIAERAQQYAGENAAELLGILFDGFGVLAPNSKELLVSVEREERFFAFQPVATTVAVLGEADEPDDLFMLVEKNGPDPKAFVLDEQGAEKRALPVVRTNQRNAALYLQINAGTAVVGRGPLQVNSAVSISIAKGDHLTAAAPEKTLYVNLVYAEREDTPVDLLPYGSGRSNLRRYGTYRVTVDASQADPSSGVCLARVTLRAKDSTVLDMRPSNAARLRVDAALTDDLIDPALVPDIERLLAREGVVDEILNLFQNRRLKNGYVVVEPGIALPPLFVRTKREPAFRQTMRQRSIAASSDRTLWTGRVVPDPTWDLTVDWNLYGVQVTKLDANTFRIDSGFDLTSIVLDPELEPLFLRFDGVDYPVSLVASANTIRTVQNVGGLVTVDPSGALHNGIDEVYVQATPERVTQNAVADKATQVVVDHPKANSMTARLRLPDGTWRVSLHGTGSDRKGVHTLTQPLPTLPAPLAVSAVTLTPHQFEPATVALDGTTKVEANPFEKVQIGAKGEPLVDTSGVDRFVDSVQNELRRIQELEVGLTVGVAFPVRTQVDGLFGGQITAGARIRVEMLTKEGWKPFGEQEVYRNTNDVVREVAWIDLNTKIFRGEVATTTAMTELGSDLSVLTGEYVEGDTVKDTEIVKVTNNADAAKNGYYRYEARQQTAPTGVDSFPMQTGGGRWVRTDLTKATFQPAPLQAVFSKMVGGADYRVTVWPIGEMADIGPSVSATTEKMRTLYNARLGVDLHKTLADMYQTFSLLLQQVDPARLDAYADELLARLRAAVQQAAAYGNPPVIEGPFRVSATPPPTVFSGSNLGSVVDVTMRYIPAGALDERSVVVEADFVVQQSVGSTPTVLVRNLPDYASLNPRFPPIVTLVFDARIKGQGIAAVRYDTTDLSVFGPTSASFKGLEVRRIASTATLGNTASYYAYFPDRTSGSLYDGPFPKLFPAGPQTLTTPHPFLTVNQASGGQTVAPKNVSARGLRFDVSGFVPGLILDVRVRQVPAETQITQQSFASLDAGTSSELFERTGLLAAQTAPVYHQIEIDEKAVTVWVEEAFVPSWNNKNFVLEFVHYDGPVVGDNCRGLTLSYLGVAPDTSGTGAAPPNSTGVNGNYLTYADGSAWVKRAGAWVAATPLRFKRHRFSVVSVSKYATEASKPDFRDVLVNVSAALESNGGDLLPPLQARELPTGALVSGAAPVQLWAKEQSLVEVVAPATFNPGSGVLNFFCWEMGDGTANGWVKVASTATAQITARPALRFLRALYALS